VYKFHNPKNYTTLSTKFSFLFDGTFEDRKDIEEVSLKIHDTL